METQQPADCCPRHGFAFVSMPRSAGEFDYGFQTKCPLLLCEHGILKADEEADYPRH